MTYKDTDHMHGFQLHEMTIQIEAPLRERAAREAAQRGPPLQAHRKPFGFTLRLTLSRSMVTIGRALQGPHGTPQQSLGDTANAAT